MSKKYYWIQMDTNFLSSTTIKIIRREGKEKAFEYIYIYLWLLLRTASTEGILQFEGAADSLEEEISVNADVDYESVAKALTILEKCHMVERYDDYIFLTKLPEMVGSETVQAEYMRKRRAELEKEKNKFKKKQEHNVTGEVTTFNDVNDGKTMLNNVTNDVTNLNNVTNEVTMFNDVTNKVTKLNDVTECYTHYNTIHNTTLQNRTLDNKHDDRGGKSFLEAYEINLAPKTEDDYLELFNELLPHDDFDSKDLKTIVDEERAIVDDLFNSYDSQKVIKAMKKAKDNGAKSFTYAKQILQNQGDSATKPPKVSNQELVIPCDNWEKLINLLDSDVRKKILADTPEEFKSLILLKTKYYTALEITDSLRLAHIEYDTEENQKIYSYFEFLLKWRPFLFLTYGKKNSNSTPEEKEHYSLSIFEQMFARHK